MRVSFIPPTVNDYDRVFNHRGFGGGLGDIRIFQPSFNAKGGSLLGFIGSIARKTIPFFQRMILPVLGYFAKDLSDDLSKSKAAKQSFKRNVKKTGKNIFKMSVLEVVSSVFEKKTYFYEKGV